MQRKPFLLAHLFLSIERARLPLSFAQQRIWFLEQLLPEMALYNIPIALKLIGDSNAKPLKSY